MSISASASAKTSAVHQYRPPPPNWVKDTGSPSSSASGTGGTQGSGGTNPFAKLATDLQAALTALQSGSTAATSTASNASTTDTLAQLQGDLQSLISKFQNDGTTQTDGAVKAVGAHHHHHAKEPDASPTSPTTASMATTGEPQSQTFVADILKAFQANFLGGGSSKSATVQPGLSIAA